MRQEKQTVTYETALCDGLRENNARGEIFGDPPDEPFRVRVVKVTNIEVIDGRGKNWQESRKDREDIADLTLAQAADLAASIVDNLAYAAVVAEKRVLIPEPKE